MVVTIRRIKEREKKVRVKNSIPATNNVRSTKMATLIEAERERKKKRDWKEIELTPSLYENR